MNTEKALTEKLFQYGVDTRKQTERSLQQKIIKIYELLELKTTQNLLLRKQNDDIKLQINTIQEVFINARKGVNQGPLHRTYEPSKNSLQSPHRQEKITLSQTYKTSFQAQQNNSKTSQQEYKQETKQRSHKYLEECQNSEQESVDTEQNTPRYSSKPHRNSRFCSNPKVNDREATSRIGNNQQKSNLDEKIQFLMKQNQVILKRMNQIQVNFISRSQQDVQNQKFQKNHDDRSTNFSSNITSIQNIWAKKEVSVPGRGLSSHNRAHYSTSNLRSYCPSVD